MSWNVNSIRTRHGQLLDWLDANEPDVVALQETKCTDEVFDELADDYRQRGYEVVHHGVDHRNGVALLSRRPMSRVQRGFMGTNRWPYDEPRLVAADCGGIDVVSVYVPNGRELDDPHYLYKLVWLERLRSELTARQPTVVAGDFNVAPTDRDIYDPSRWRRRTHASAPERAAVEALLDAGYVDIAPRFFPDEAAFTWFSYRPGQFEKNQGLRIDLALVQSDLADSVRAVRVDYEQRRVTRPSDHAPLSIEFDG